MDKKEFGKYFAYIRKKSGFKSQRQLSSASGINNATIARIEDGSQKVKPETLKKLSQYLKGVSYGTLLEKAGYIDHLSFKEKEAFQGKDISMEFTEYQIEKLLKTLTLNQRYSNEVIEELERILKEFNINTNGSLTPDTLLKISQDITNLDLKIKINEVLFDWVNFYKLSMKNIQIQGKSALDILDEPKNDNDLFTIIHFIEKDKNSDNNFVILENSTTKNRPAFAYRVRDNSMTNEGILEGDVVICVEERYTEPDDISVVLYFDDEVLLRKVQYHDDFCMLIPSNSSLQPEIVEDTNNIEVIGKVIQSRRNFE